METLKMSITDQVATITFTRPNVLNALNSKVFEELISVFDQLEASDNLRVVILTGEGKAFVAGADIAEMHEKNPGQARIFSQIGHDVFSRIENFKVPVIAAVNGFALGGGLELAISCDFIVASENAKFSAPEVNLGLIPGFNGTQRLPRLVGPSYAKYMLFTCQAIDSQEALRIGLVQLVTPHESIMDKTYEIAKLIGSKGPQAIESVKRTVNYGLMNGYKEGSKMEMHEFSEQFNEEGQEGMLAFLEKRKPVWKY
jgi:enoyl-CoA hydratase